MVAKETVSLKDCLLQIARVIKENWKEKEFPILWTNLANECLNRNPTTHNPNGCQQAFSVFKSVESIKLDQNFRTMVTNRTRVNAAERLMEYLKAEIPGKSQATGPIQILAAISGSQDPKDSLRKNLESGNLFAAQQNLKSDPFLAKNVYEDGMTTFHLAKNLKCMEELIKHVPEPAVLIKKKNKKGLDALQHAVSLQRLETGRKLSETISINEKEKADYTIWASKNNFPLMLELLQDIDVHAVDENERDALSHAAETGSSKIVEELTDRGANPNSMDNKGNTPAHYAAANCHPMVIDVLSDRGADMDCMNYEGDTPLITACQIGDPETVKSLIKNGADTRAQNNRGDTAATILAKNGMHPEVCEVLFPVSDLDQTNYNGESILTINAQNRNLEGVKITLNAGANPNTTNSEGKTALKIASENADERICNVLLENNVTDPDIPDNNNRTALHSAAQTGMEGVVQRILPRSNNPNQPDKDGKSPVFFAADKKTVQVFTNEPRTNFDLQDKDGNNPMMEAVKESRFEVASALVPKTNGDTINRSGKTAASLAQGTSVASEIAEQTAKKRGAMAGDLEIGLSWCTYDDLDVSVICPHQNRCYFGKRNLECCGLGLDVDANVGHNILNPVEHIRFEESKSQGTFTVIVMLYSRASQSDVIDIPYMINFKIKDQKYKEVNGTIGAEKKFKGISQFTFQNGKITDWTDLDTFI